MTIDISKIKKGDTVVFRCGGKATVISNRNGCLAYDTGVYDYQPDGTLILTKQHLLDIISIEPAHTTLTRLEELRKSVNHPSDSVAYKIIDILIEKEKAGL